MRTLRFIRGILPVAVAAAIIAVPGAADAQRKVPSSNEQIRLSFAPLVKRAAPAVVNIYAKRVVTQRPISPFFNDPFFRRFFGDDFPRGRERKRIQNSLGSGVIVKPGGLVVTNHHVIKKADEITVVLADRREYDAKVVLTDERTDLAVLKIDPGRSRLPFLSLRDSDDLEVGDLVLAIGNPFGVGQTVTSGIVSALARTARGISDFSFFIQTDAAINPGNSGGALVTMDGRLVGINSAIYSRSGGSIGIGFAIPSNMVAAVIRSATGGGKVVRPWLGASTQNVTPNMAKSLKLPRPIGVMVTSVYRGGPADRAGLKTGDVVARVNGREVADKTSLRFRLGTLAVGGKATLRVYRNGKARSVSLRLVKAPEAPPRNITKLDGPHPFAGSEVANMSPALAEQLGIEDPEPGVIIYRIRRRGPAYQLGLKPGDMVISVNGTPIKRVRDLRRVLVRRSARWYIELHRDDEVLTLNIRG